MTLAGLELATTVTLSSLVGMARPAPSVTVVLNPL